MIISVILEDIQDLTASFSSFSVVHAKRAANTAAHCVLDLPFMIVIALAGSLNPLASYYFAVFSWIVIGSCDK